MEIKAEVQACVLSILSLFSGMLNLVVSSAQQESQESHQA
jgi:hypothetical protein